MKPIEKKWTRNDTVVTTTSMTAVNVSMRKAQVATSLPEVNQLPITTWASAPPATMTKAIQERTKQTPSRPVVTYSAPRAPIQGPKMPAMRKPRSGRKTISWYKVSALQRIDVLNSDRAAIAVIGHQDRKADCGLRRGDRQNEEREGLPRQVARIGRERDEVDIHGKKDELDRHQDDDDVLVV